MLVPRNAMIVLVLVLLLFITKDVTGFNKNNNLQLIDNKELLGIDFYLILWYNSIIEVELDS
jgi:hypothetical protein